MEIFKALFLNKETGGERRKYFLQLLTNDWKWPELIPGNGVSKPHWESLLLTY